MLDNIKPARLKKLGTVIVGRGAKPCSIRVKGFAADDCSCRDVSALALVWAIGELQRELNLLLESPGASDVGIG